MPLNQNISRRDLAEDREPEGINKKVRRLKVRQAQDSLRGGGVSTTTTRWGLTSSTWEPRLD